PPGAPGRGNSMARPAAALRRRPTALTALAGSSPSRCPQGSPNPPVPGMSSHPGPDTQEDFDAWLQVASPKILRDAYFVTRDPKLAEDIAQEATLKFFKAWANEEMRGKILTQPGYIRTTIYHCYLDHIKVPSRTNLREAAFDVARHDRSGTEIDHDLRLAVL